VSYNAPLKDMLFVMNELANLSEINRLPGCEDATPDTVEAVLEENAKFCGEVVAPLNHPGVLAVDAKPRDLRTGRLKWG
jgi:hypothetical protein